MAARRLIAILIVLMIISTIAAGLADVEQEQRETTTTTEQPIEADQSAGGELIRSSLAAQPQGERLPVIEAVRGDQLSLRVDAHQVVEVEVAALGLRATAGPGSPARFDLVLREAGTIPVRIAGGETIGRIEVRQRPEAD
jgi:hypothetical protein